YRKLRFSKSYLNLHIIPKRTYILPNKPPKPTHSIFISPAPPIFEPDWIGKVMQGYQWTYPFFKKQLNFCTVLFQGLMKKMAESRLKSTPFHAHSICILM